MADIVSRHIRHDWRTWDDSKEQKSVKALCGVKTRPHLAGIPGVTHQSFWLQRRSDGQKVFGWCWSCSREFVVQIGDIPPGVPVELHPVYERAIAFADVIRDLLRPMNAPNWIWGG